MSAIATVLAAMGHQVTGSDLKDSAALERPRAVGVGVHVGHDAANLGDVDAVTISTAVPAANPEVVAARAAGDPGAAPGRDPGRHRRHPAARRGGRHPRQDDHVVDARPVLVEAGLHPSFIIGGDVNEIGTGAVWDAHPGEPFVVEADESDGTFLELARRDVVVTNVEPDHLEHYGGFERVGRRLRPLRAATRPASAWSAPTTRAAPRWPPTDRGASPTGSDRGCDCRMVDCWTRAGAAPRFAVRPRRRRRSARSRLAVPGVHNARNARRAGDGRRAGRAVRRRGARPGPLRRGGPPLAVPGEADGITFIDDYAHLPTEVRRRARHRPRRRLGAGRVVFQPHRYSRTASLWPTSPTPSAGADLLVVTDVYPAGEAPRPGVTGKLIVDAVLDAHPWRAWPGSPPGATSSPTWPASCAPATCASRWAPATSPSLPDEVIGRRRRSPPTG